MIVFTVGFAELFKGSFMDLLLAVDFLLEAIDLLGQTLVSLALPIFLILQVEYTRDDRYSQG